MTVHVEPSTQTNTAHVAMWAVSILFLVGGGALALVGNHLITSSGLDVQRVAQGSGVFLIGTSVASIGLLLFLIAWTIAAARR